MAAVFDLYGYAPFERFALARPVAEFAQRAHDRYGSFDGYARTEVLPYLAARGLLERREARVLGIFPVTRWRQTRAGENARARLESIPRLPPAQFDHWLERDPARARAFLDEAGSALLLAAPLHPELKRLGNQLAHDDAFLDFDLDLNVFDGLGDALSALDAGVIGGDGGGDWDSPRSCRSRRLPPFRRCGSQPITPFARCCTLRSRSPRSKIRA